MSQIFQCGDNTALVGYLYGECDPAERTAIDSHVSICAACAAELAALQSTRSSLAAWVPPEAGLGFQIVRPADPALASGPSEPGRALNMVKPQRWYARPVPVWAQVAAAVVIFASGLALGVVRGTRPIAAPAGVAAASTPGNAMSATGNVVSASDLADLERRLRAEMARLTPAAAGAGDGGAPAVSEAQVLARVRTLIEESEQRQQRELAKQTAQVMRDFDSQRQVDLARIEQSFGQIEGLTGAEVRQQRQMLDYLIRASERP
jgi:anti-sigma factor RsiW